MENKTHKKSRITLAIFVVLAFLFWIGKELGKSFELDIPIELSYINFPQDKILANPLVENITINVKSDGYTILGHYFNLFENKVEIDINKKSTANYITGKELKNQFSSQLHDIDIAFFKPDTLFFDFDAATTKKVPIKLSTDFELSPEYAIKGVPSIFPDSIIVKGPNKLIDTLGFWLTNLIQIKGLENSLNNNISLKTPAIASIELSENLVRYEVQVERVTEKTFTDIPIKIESHEIANFINLIPAKAKITFKAFLSDLPLLKQEDFEVEADFSNISIADQTKVPIRVVSHPQNVQFIQVSPAVCDFIIIKQ